MHKIRSVFRKSTSSPRFQILSDLHLEVGQQYSSFHIPPVAQYLILAGDIGRLIDYAPYLAFLAKQTQTFERVFLVLGNHEFYGLSFTTGLEAARKLESEPILKGKLLLLHQQRINIPSTNISILGCTLWSRINFEAHDIVQMKVKDFQKIEEWSVDAHNLAHVSDITWLRDQVAAIQQEKEASLKENKRKILVVTHHAPSVIETARPEQVGNAWSSAFATDVLGGEIWESVKVWVFGHTHFTTDFKKSGIRVVSNQRGYVLPGVEQKSDENDKKKVFDVRRAIYV